MKVFISTIFMIFVLFSSVCFGQESSKTEVDVVQKVLYEFVKTNKKHPLYNNENLRREFSRMILTASEKSEVPWELILIVSFCESSFRPEVIGSSHGEVGVMQLNGSMPWKHCREKEKRKLDKTSAMDQYVCGSHWLRFSIESCDGSIYQGLSKYATGGVCSPKKNGSLDYLVRRRVKFMNRAMQYAKEVL